MNKPLIYFGFLSAFFFNYSAYSQSTTPTDRSLSAGINLGLISPISPFGGRNDYSRWSPSIGYGVYGKKQLLSNVFLRADFLGGKFSGSDKSSTNSQKGSYSSYSTNLNYSLAVSAGINTNNIPVLRNQYQLRLSAQAGWGVAGYQVSNFSAANKITTKQHYNSMIVPVGVGAEVSLTDQLAVSLGWTVGFVDHDGLDGRFTGPNDRFNYLHAGIGYFFGQGKLRAGQHSKENKYDDLAAAAKDAQKIDLLEKKIDQLTQQNQHLEAQIKDWFVDSDGDGVVDNLDKCPATAKGTVVDGAGCPIKIPVPVSIKPVVSEEDKDQVRQALRNVYFEPQSPNVAARSLVYLNTIVNLLEEKGFGIRLSSYTDNRGSASFNLNLSRERAETIKAYMLSVGGDSTRIQVQGYGSAKPVASNRTYKGRQKNNRIEFVLY